MLTEAALAPPLNFLRYCGLVDEGAEEQTLQLFHPRQPFAEVVRWAESVHVHVKVSDVRNLPHEQIRRQGGVADRWRSSYVKYRFPAGINVVFSSDPVAEDDLVEAAAPASRPFVDHLGVDVRHESAPARRAFESIPETSAGLGWRCVRLVGPVVGYHVEVPQEHWCYPPEGPDGERRPVEVAFGAIVVHDTYSGCDLRPIDPAHRHAALARRAAERRHRDLIRRWPRAGIDAGHPS